MAYGTEASRYIYRHLPATLRDAAATFYAAKTYRSRFGGPFRQVLLELEREQWCPSADVIASSADKAERFAHTAARDSAWYSSLGLAPTAGLSSFPVLTKDTLRLHNAAIQSVSLQRRRTGIIHRHTSGTTGTPLKIAVTMESLQRENGYVWHHRAWLGCGRGATVATIAGHPVTPVEQELPPFWVRNYYERQLIMSSYHMSTRHLPSYARAIATFSPRLIHGYPSSVALVAEAVIASGLSLSPRAVVTSSETLLPHQAHVIDRAFGTPPRTFYGNTEMAGCMAECAAGRVHVLESHSFVEFLLENDTVAPPGAVARVVVTPFANAATYLVRYDTGDRAVLSAHPSCPCGRSGRIVECLVGRMEEYIIDASDRLVGRLDHLFKDARGVVAAQLVQEEPGRVIVRIVGDSHTRRVDIEDDVCRAARDRLAPGTEIRFEHVDALERSRSGKTPFVLSRLTQRPKPHHTDRLLDEENQS